jgi:predicted nucleic acid-binding protein
MDTGYWIGLRNGRDRWHETSKRIARRLIDERAKLTVTPFIFAEVQASFSRDRIARQQIIRDIWENPVVETEQVTGPDQVEAIQLLRQRHDQSFSFCDALSYIVMTRLKIQAVVSYDRHFHQFGGLTVIDGTSF